MEMPRMAREILRERLRDPETILIDLRHDPQDGKKKIPGAVREDPERLDEWTGKYRKDLRMVLYCSSPGEKVSAEAARSLLLRGFPRVYALQGGWQGWRDAGYPIEQT